MKEIDEITKELYKVMTSLTQSTSYENLQKQFAILVRIMIQQNNILKEMIATRPTEPSNILELQEALLDIIKLHCQHEGGILESRMPPHTEAMRLLTKQDRMVIIEDDGTLVKGAIIENAY